MDSGVATTSQKQAETEHLQTVDGQDKAATITEPIAPNWQNKPMQLALLNGGGSNVGPPCEAEQEISGPEDEESRGSHYTLINFHSNTATAQSSASTQNRNVRALEYADIANRGDIQLERVDEAAAGSDNVSFQEPKEQDDIDIQYAGEAQNLPANVLTAQKGVCTLFLKVVQSAEDPTQTVCLQELQLGNKRYMCVPIEDSNLSNLEATINNQPCESTSRTPFLDETVFAKLAASNILQKVPTTIGLMSGDDLNKQIIATYGKKVFDLIFDADEIKAVRTTAKRNADDCTTGGLDESKVFIVAAFVSWLISKPDLDLLTIDEFEKYAENAVKEYNSGLSPEDVKYLRNNVIIRYGYGRKTELSGVKKEAKRRKKASSTTHTGVSKVPRIDEP